MKIKICGLSRPEDIEYVNEALPDYIGFVFAKSKRQVTAEQAEKLKSKLNSGIQTVGVFVDAPIEEVVLLLERRIIDIVQLHGSENNEYMASLKAKTGCSMIKAIRVETAEDIIAAQSNPADYLLLDHGAGGTGQAFDWTLVQECKKPFFLAGGIHIGNIEQAMKTGDPYAVDLSRRC